MKIDQLINGGLLSLLVSLRMKRAKEAALLKAAYSDCCYLSWLPKLYPKTVKPSAWLYNHNYNHHFQLFCFLDRAFSII
jgi:hypothetical protein